MREILIIDQSEDIASVVDRLLKIPADEVVVKLPMDSVLFSSHINFRLLKRESESLNKKIIVSTDSREGMTLAREAGLDIDDKNKEEEETPAEDGEERETEARPAPKKKTAPQKFLRRSTVGSLSDIVPVVPKKSIVSEDSLLKEGFKKEVSETEDVSRTAGGKIDFKNKETSEKEKEDFVIEDDLLSWLEDKNELSGAEREEEKDEDGARENDIFNDRFLKSRAEKTHSRFSFFAVHPLRILAGAALFAVVVVGFMVLPRAEVKIVPKEERVEIELRVTADSNISTIDKKYNRIPAQVVSVDKTVSRFFPASGSKNVSEKAGGTITIFNELDSTPQTIIPSRFETQDGKIYWSVETVIVPGASLREGTVVPGEKQVEISASEAGPAYNRSCSVSAPCNFVIPAWRGTVKFDKIYARASSDIFGGAEGMVKVAAGRDIIDAMDAVLEEAKREAAFELKKKLPPDLVAVEGSSQESIEEHAASLKEGEMGENFEAKARVTIKAYLFNPSQLVELARESIASRLGDGKKLASSLENVEYKQVRIDGLGGKISFTSSGKAVVIWDIDAENIKNEILGKDEIELRSHLSSAPGVETAYIKLWPFWVKKVPANASRVFVGIDRN